jgi:class 3 adenylate cyclase/predicted ATPase
LLVDARFCGECGTPVDGARPDGAQLTHARTPSREPAAERRLVSVLFADLVGFTPFAEGRDAEDVRDTLSRYFELATDTVNRYGGTIEKFIGDAVMAVWGAPTAQEDDPERAVRAALELVESVPALFVGIEARVGVLTGEAAVNPLATNQGLVAGDLVNTAARLQAAAPAGAVLVGETTQRAAAGAVAFESIGELTLKGKALPVPAWRAVRVVAQRGGSGRAALPEPPFVGRSDELRTLRDAVTAVGRDRRPRLISISGPAGIGKSRLAWELEKYVDGVSEPIYWHRGRSPAYGEGITFWALGEMVRRRAGAVEGDADATTRERIAAVVADYVPDHTDAGFVEPALRALLGLEPPPAGGRDVLFAAWRIFFERIAERGTTILLFEDLQWADSGLLDFVDHLLDWAKCVPLLVVTLARSELFERRPDWGAGRRAAAALSLDPLPDDAMRQLLAGYVSGLPASAVEAILARADGIPLYAVETVRALVADGKLVGAGDRYRPTGDIGDLAIPPTLHSLIAARLDGLDPIDRALLQDAAVLGQVFTRDGIAALAGGVGADLDDRLRRLLRRQFLEVEADPRSPERGQYRFVQSLIREVAYATMARAERHSRHLAAARYFESLGDDELAGVLAAHYVAAYQTTTGAPEREAAAAQARVALRGGAQRAAALGAHAQALAFLEQALAITEEPTERANLNVRAAEAAHQLGRYGAAEKHARNAIDGFAGSADPDRASEATAALASILIDAGAAERARELLEAALGEAPAGQPAEAVLATDLARAQFRLNRYREAIASADRALDIAERLNLDVLVAEALLNKGTALGAVGRRRESAAILEGVVRQAETAGFTAAELRGRNNLVVSLWDDDPVRALDIITAGAALARKVGSRSMADWLTGTLGSTAYLAGRDWDEALSSLEEALGAATEASDRLQLLEGYGNLAAARGDALRTVRIEVRELASRVSEPREHAWAYSMDCSVGLASGDFRAVLEAATRASELDPDETGWFTTPFAIHAALWARDLEGAVEAASRMERHPYTGTGTNAIRIGARAGIAALEGRRADALSGFQTSTQTLRRIGRDFELALEFLDMVVLLGAKAPEVSSVVPEARAILTRLRATPYLSRLPEEGTRDEDAARMRESAT